MALRQTVRGGEITRIDLKQSKYDFKSELKKPLQLR